MKKIFQNLCFLWKERSSRKWVISFLTAWFALLILWGITVFLLDPYIVFHPAIGLKAAYRNSYAMLPGILRNESYDTLMIGSSMCQNFELKDIQHILGGAPVKATAPGLSGEDANQFLRVAFQRNDITLRRVIIGVDLWSYSNQRNAHWRNYHYLYERQWSWEYFYSTDTVEAVFNLIVTNLAPAGNRGSDLEKDRNRMFSDKLWRWEYSRESFESSIAKQHLRPDSLDASCQQKLDDFILFYAKRNPKVHFDLFLPPYSACFWAMQRSNRDLTEYLNARLALAEAVEKLPNVTLHDFQTDVAIVTDFDRYTDISHYDPNTNREILKSIRRQDHKIDGYVAMMKANQDLRILADQWLPYYRTLREQKEK